VTVPKTAYAQLERKLAADPTAILDLTEIRLLNRELQHVLVSSLPTLPADILDRGEDTIRWHALGARCAQARGTRGIRDIAVAMGIPQYRIRAIETARLTEFRLDLARRYFCFLGIETWIAQWCRANRELATRVGLLDTRPLDRRARQPRGD
jgi:hypothetical protein